jgi:hypothetical protein
LPWTWRRTRSPSRPSRKRLYSNARPPAGRKRSLLLSQRFQTSPPRPTSWCSAEPAGVLAAFIYRRDAPGQWYLRRTPACR